jgi:hypothetical protein
MSAPAVPIISVLEPLFPVIFIGSVLTMGLCLGVFSLAKAFLHGSGTKGAIGEGVVNWVVLSRLDPAWYTCFKNVFIPSRTGRGMTEIDHLVVSVHGIFVIETKNHSGWIFGSADQRSWTQTHFRKKHTFLNPLKQNQTHINALAAFLMLPREAFHSIIFFVGEAELKTPMPPNVLTSGLLTYIRARRELVLTSEQVAIVRSQVTAHEARMDKSAVRREHVARVSSRFKR